MRKLLVFLAISALAACSEPAPAGAGSWSLDRAEPNGVLLSVWGSGATDVWAAGGQVGRGLVLHSDGSTWTPVETGVTPLVWWIYGFGPADVYAVGEKGLVEHFDGHGWTRVDAGTDATLYGLWGTSGDDVWLVGGDASGRPGSAVVRRGSASRGFHAVDVPAELVPDAFFKVYGISKSTVLVVGRGGTVLRFDGAGWTRDEVPTQRPIISLWSRSAQDVYAVGGQDVGEFLHFDGVRWSTVPGLGAAPGLNGVFTAPGRPVFAVGTGPEILEISTSGEAVREAAPGLGARSVLHSVWGDENGTVYAVGGDLLAYPGTMSGVVIRRP